MYYDLIKLKFRIKNKRNFNEFNSIKRLLNSNSNFQHSAQRTILLSISKLRKLYKF